MKTLLKAVFIALITLGSALSAFAQDPAIILRYANRQVFNNGMSWKFDLEAKGNATYGGVENGSWIAMNVRADLGLPAGVTITSGNTVGAPGHTISSGFQLNVQGNPPQGYTEFGITLERGDLGTELSNTDFAVIATVTINFSGPVNQGDDAIPRVIPNNAGSSWVNLAQELLQRPFEFVELSFPLPVKLVSFNASKEGLISQLTWQTSEEVNSERFDVQRSSDGKAWKTIGNVQAQGDRKVVFDYHFADESPLSGTNLYRLQMIDKDGTSAFSKIIALKFDSELESVVYPNPALDQLFIKTAKPDQISLVQIYDSAGVEVYKSERYSEKGISTGKLAGGVYVVKITNKNNEVSSFKTVISK